MNNKQLYIWLIFIIVFLVVISLLTSSITNVKDKGNILKNEPEPIQADYKIVYVSQDKAEVILRAIAVDFGLDENLLVSMARLETQMGRLTVGKNNWYNLKNGNKGYIDFEDAGDSAVYTAKLITTDKRYYSFQLTGLLEDLAIVYAEDKDYAIKLNKILCEYGTK